MSLLLCMLKKCVAVLVVLVVLVLAADDVVPLLNLIADGDYDELWLSVVLKKLKRWLRRKATSRTVV